MLATSSPDAAGAAAARPTAAAAFYGNSVLMRSLRGLLRGAQRVSPALAGRLARQLFCTPLPTKRAAARQPVPAGYRLQRWPFERTSLAVYQPVDTAADAPRVLLAHGWAGAATQWLPLAEALRAQGFAPVLVDFPAHGRAGAWTSSLPQFARAIEYLVARLGQEEPDRSLHAVIGHSLGATAVAMACARGASVQRIVLVAPAGSPQGYSRSFAGAFGLAEPARSEMQRGLEAREAMLMTDYDVQALAPRLQLPTLVVHDRQDRVNAFADGQAYARLAPRSQLLETDELGHRRVLREPAVVTEVSRFVAASPHPQ